MAGYAWLGRPAPSDTSGSQRRRQLGPAVTGWGGQRHGQPQVPCGAVNLVGCGWLGLPVPLGSSGSRWLGQHCPRLAGRLAPPGTSGSCWHHELGWLQLAGAACVTRHLRIPVGLPTWLALGGWDAEGHQATHVPGAAVNLAGCGWLGRSAPDGDVNLGCCGWLGRPASAGTSGSQWRRQLD